MSKKGFKKNTKTFILIFLLLGGGFFIMRHLTTKVIPIEKKSLSSNSLDIQTLFKKNTYSKNIYTSNISLLPPTNKWFSSLAFSQPSEPIYAYPLALKTTKKGFGISHPSVVIKEDAILASYSQDLDITFKDKDIISYVSHYDDLSVEGRLKHNADSVATFRLTRGSPFVFLSLSKDVSLKIVAQNFKISPSTQNSILIKSGKKTYQIVTDSNSEILKNNSSNEIEIVSKTDETKISIAIIPENSDPAQFIEYAKNPIISTMTTYSEDKADLKTTYSITTEKGGDTLLGLLPLHYKNSKELSSSIGSYKTIRGDQKLYKGTSFSFSIPKTVPQELLNLSNISADQKQTLTSLLKKDIEMLSFRAEDTYFGGKSLFKAANLLTLATQLQLTEEQSILKTKLKEQLQYWFDEEGYKKRTNKYFYYEESLKGMVGITPSFGSELFNDHHFHYGYFIYAASVLAKQDPDFLKSYKNNINFLVKDIANTDRKSLDFPYLRVFDTFEGHSWASGLGAFADGNNQESSSEAVNAWFAIHNWALLIEDKDLEAASLWMYNLESKTALENWLNIDLKDPLYKGYNHTIVSLLWNGKLDYTTFFDNAPESKLAIQLLPFTSGSTYLSLDKTRIIKNLAQMKQELKGKEPSKFKDYLLMYESMANQKSALQKLPLFKDNDIDDGNSLTYLHAWVYSQKP